MRPLFHPAVEDVNVEGILHALSDLTRVQILAQIVSAQCSQICSAFLEVSDKPIPKSTLSQHFNVLRQAGLIRSERRGVEMHNTPRLEELDERFGPLIRSILDAHAAQNDRRRRVGKSKRLKKAA
jgi:DNA-binding transcriptional ArsR family regulator